jgi:hypothetical protein
MLQSTDYFNTSHSINTVEETAYMAIMLSSSFYVEDNCTADPDEPVCVRSRR